MQQTSIRPSALAGAWYPDDPSELRMSIEGWLAKHRAPPDSADKGRLTGLILPHAGHRYSGLTMAAGVSRMSGGAGSRVVMIGPSHRAMFQGAVLSGASHFQTPLGLVPLDRDAVVKLSAAGVPVSDGVHGPEHCLEIIVPFLQVAIRKFSIVPVLIGRLTDADRTHLAASIGDLLDERTILIASSDFIHYGADFGYLPDVGPDARAGVRRLDEGAIEKITSMDAAGLLAYYRKTDATICGIMPITLLLSALPKKTRVEFAHYSQSADVTHDTDHMVSYAALAFYAP